MAERNCHRNTIVLSSFSPKLGTAEEVAGVAETMALEVRGIIMVEITVIITMVLHQVQTLRMAMGLGEPARAIVPAAIFSARISRD